ncbi:hypothetical protein J3B02_002279 [Coemansia erecta]|nr:hypothetical protein J3B02_002279 [Coemansia erecta]
MLKAFSKVFHKTQGSPDEQLKGGAAHGQVSGAQLQPTAPPPEHALRHTSERVHVAGLGVDVSSLGSQRRNAGEDSQPRPFVVDGGMRSAKEPSRRVSLQQRIEQQIQPRLHMKSPTQGTTDGRFALTADNIEWHLRMCCCQKIIKKGEV